MVRSANFGAIYMLRAKKIDSLQLRGPPKGCSLIFSTELTMVIVALMIRKLYFNGKAEISV